MAGNPLLPADPSQVPYGQLADFAAGEQQRQAALTAEPALAHTATPAPSYGSVLTATPPEPQSGIGLRGPSAFPQAPGTNPVDQAIVNHATGSRDESYQDGTILAALALANRQGGGQAKVGESQTMGSQGMAVTPEMTQTRKEARAHSEQAAELRGAQGAAAEGRAGEIAQVIQQRAAATAELNAAQEKALAEQQANLEKMRVEQEKLRSEYVQQAKSLNPDRLLSTGGNRAVAAISVALGALGSAFTKGPNFALDIINSAIDRDYQSQKDRLGASRENLSLSQQSMNQVRQMYSDSNAQAAAHRANMLTVYADKIGELAARHGGAVERENGQIMQQTALAQAAADDLKAQQIQARTNTNSVTQQFSAAPTGAAAVKGILEVEKLAAETKDARDKAYGPKVSEQDRGEAVKVKEKFADAYTLMEQLEELRKLNANPGTRNFNALRDTLISKIAQKQANVNSGQSVTNEEREEYRKQLVGAWHTVTEGGYNALVDQAKLDMMRNLRGHLGRVTQPQLQQDVLNASRLDADTMRAIQSGQYTGQNQAEALGGTVRQ